MGEIDGDGAGYGVGYGAGAGVGYGDGAGVGYGDGDGVGAGVGYGAGDGYGYGAGDVYGDGDGDGAGYGYGYGAGAGVGYGAGDYYTGILQCVPLAIQRQSEGCCLGFWRSDKKGSPCNGGSGTVAHVGLIEEIEGPLKICTPQSLHGTRAPEKWKGARLWIVALYPPYEQQDDKIGSLKREFLAEIPNFFM